MSRTVTQRTSEKEPFELAQPSRSALALVPAACDQVATDGQEPYFPTIVEHARRATRASGAALALEKDGKIVCCAQAGEHAPSLGAELDREAGVSGLCLRSGEIVHCTDAASDNRVDGEAAKRLGVRSILAVPLKSQDNIIGLLEAFSESANAFGPDEEALLRSAAKRIVARRERGSDVASVRDILAGIDNTPARAGAAPPAEGEAAAPLSDVAPVATATSDPSHSVDIRESVSGGEYSSGWGMSRRRLLWTAGFALVAILAIGLSLRTGAAGRSGATPSSAPVSAQARWVKTAESSDPAAQYELALRYRWGNGVPRDDGEAVRWLKEAARQGNADAQFELGNAYVDGRGVERDPIYAYACYVLASGNGNSASEEALRFLTPKLTDAQISQVRETVAQMYLLGRGTPVSLSAAYTWFTLAEYAGNPEARREKQALASKMSRHDVAAANRRAIEWLRRHGQQPR